MRWWSAPVAALLLAGCVAQSNGKPESWYQQHGRIVPAGTSRVWVCHGFGCAYRTVVTFSPRDIAVMRKIMGKPRTAAEERRNIRRLIAWAEKRVAPEAGSANDVAGLDIGNARVRGQMDCLDEATNTTSYLLIAERNGLLRHHTVAKPVARGFFLDGRYPHATAVINDGGQAFAVDSWPMANGELPDILPLEEWFARYPFLE